MRSVTNVVVAGLGGQGVLKASDILSEAAFRAGFDVKKSEVHGMSQRGGSVNSDVRFGDRILSPMVPAGAADFLVVIAEDQVEVNRWRLREGGVLVSPSTIEGVPLKNPKSLNVALLGVLAAHLGIPEEHWSAAIQANLPEKIHAVNLEAFEAGKGSAAAAAQ